MKKFDIPTLTIVDGTKMEPVYAASGCKPGGGHGGFGGNKDVGTEWCNHNSGSHSEIKVKCHNSTQKSGDNIRFDLRCNGFKLHSVTPGDGCLIVTNQTQEGFTLTRVNRHYNPGENVEFVMQLTCKNSQYGHWENGEVIGAVGKTGSPTPCSVSVTDFELF